MDFQSLSRRQLQALCKKNKIPANITNAAMAHALASLHLVEGIEEILNSEVPQSPMVPPTAGRTGTAAQVVGPSATPSPAATIASRRRAAAASTSVRRDIEVLSCESLDEIEGKKSDASMKTPASRRRVVKEMSTVKPVYSIRRSARLAKNIEEPKERSEVIMIDSSTEEIDEIVEVEMKESSVHQSEISEITVPDNFKKMLTFTEEIELRNNDEYEANSEEKSDIPNEDVAVASIEQIVVGEIKADTEMSSNVDKETKASMEKDSQLNTNVDEEAQASTEKETEMQSNVGDEAKAFIEKDTGMSSIVEDEIEMQSNVGEEAKAFIEKETGINFNVEEETEMQSNVGEEAVAFIEKETVINSNVEEETEASIEEKTEMNFNVCEGIKASTEKDTEMYSNVDEGTTASIEKDTETPTNVDEEAQTSTEKETEMQSDVGAEAKEFIEKETGMRSNVEEETDSSIEEKTKMNFNVSEETKASIEKDAIVDEEAMAFTDKDTERNSSVNEETIEKEAMVVEEAKAFTEKDIEMNSNVNEEARDFFEVIEMNSNEDDETKASIAEDTNMNFKEDVEIVIAEFKGNEESDTSDGHELVDDKDNLESVTEFNQEEMVVSEDNFVPEVEIQNELMNSEAKHESDISAIGSDPIHFDAPLINDDVSSIEQLKTSLSRTPLTKSADKAPRTVEGLTQISDDKENVDSGRKSILLKCGKPTKMPYEGYSIRKLEKMLQEKLKRVVSEDIVVPEVKIQNELLNSEAKHESDFSAIGSDPIHIDAPLINDDVSSIEQLKTSLSRTPLTKSADKAPRTVKGLTQISDDKENVDSGRNLILLKCGKPTKMPYEGYSIRKLEKMLQEKLKKVVSEDIVVPEVEIQNELLNSEAKHESDFSPTGSDPTHIVAPLINDHVSSIESLKTSLNRTSTKSGNKAPITVEELTQIPDDKEKVDSGRKSILLKSGKPKKMPYDDCRVRKLEKMLQEKLKNTDNLDSVTRSSQQKKRRY